MLDVGGLATFAPFGLRRQVRAIGFNHEAIHGNDRGGISEQLRFGIGYVAREGEMEAEGEALFGEFGATAEAVHDAVRKVAGIVAEDFEAIFVRVTIVDDDGLVQLAGDVELFAE